VTKKSQPFDEAALYDYAVRALGRRMRTVAELKCLMKTRVEAGDSGEAKMRAVIARLHEYRYLDDAAYATTFIRLRQDNEKFGRRRVQQDLARKGIGADRIASALDKSYENVSEETLAREHLVRKRIAPPANEKETARVVRLLVRAGFSTGTIFKVLKEWRVGDETLAALETIDTSGDPER
jgi:regulatory protein